MKKLSAAEEFDVKMLLRHAAATANKLVTLQPENRMILDLKSCVTTALGILQAEKADVG